MSCWAVQSGLRIDSLFPVSFALPKEAVMLDDLASGVPFALGGGWVLGITGVWLEPELQPKAANPLSVLILFLSASSPYHHAALSGLRGQLREESHVTPHQPRTKQNLQALNTNPSSPWRVIYRRLSHFAGQRLALTQASLWTPWVRFILKCHCDQDYVFYLLLYLSSECLFILLGPSKSVLSSVVDIFIYLNLIEISVL